MKKARMLGLFEFYSSDLKKQIIIRSKKSTALLVYFILNENNSFSRVQLADLLWGEFDEKRARHNLRQCILELKRYLPEDSIISSRHYLKFNREHVECDVNSLKSYCQSNSIEKMEKALNLYKGELMQDFYLDSQQFDFWLDEKRFEIYELVRSNMSQLLYIYIQKKYYLKAILLARRMLSLDPLNENIHQVLMHLYAQQGRRSEAIKQYQHCRSILFKELSLEPTSKTQQLHNQLTSQSNVFPLLKDNVESIKSLVL